MDVSDVMTTSVATIDADDTVRAAARVMREENVSGLPVMEEDRVVGVVSESDVLRLLETHELHEELWLPSPFEPIEVPIRELVNWVESRRDNLIDIGEKKVREVMNRRIITIRPGASIEDAAEKMVRHGVNRLPVLEDEQLVGIVTRGDIIQGLGRL